MYPGRELAALAGRKAILQARIEVRRWECAVAMAELSRPLVLVDRGLAAWRRISPLVKLLGLPAGFLGARKLFRFAGRGKLSKLVGLLPVVLRTAQTVMRMRASRPRASAAAH